MYSGISDVASNGMSHATVKGRVYAPGIGDRRLVAQASACWAASIAPTTDIRSVCGCPK